MAIAEASVAYDVDERQYLNKIDTLRELAASGLQGASSQATRVISDIKAFVEWLDDPRLVFTDEPGRDDKFAELINLSRDFRELNSFYVSEVGVNSSTVWRWATKKSRPSKFVGTKLAHEVERLLANVLWQIACDQGLVEFETRVRKAV